MSPISKLDNKVTFRSIDNVYCTKNNTLNQENSEPIAVSRLFAYLPPILTAGLLLYSRYCNYYHIRYAKLRLGILCRCLIIGNKVWVTRVPKFQ